MKIKKGDKLPVNCRRKGVYNAVATKDFDTEKDDWDAVALDQDEPIQGASSVWEKGDDVPCRNGGATVTKRT